MTSFQSRMMIEAPGKSSIHTVRASGSRWMANGLVFSALMAFAFWGHATEWRFGLRRDAPINGKAINDLQVRVSSNTLTFNSPADVEKAGVDIVAVWEAPMVDAITASGEARLDDRRIARLSSRAAGTAFQVLKRVGDHVKAGDALAIIDSAEVGKAKFELQQAIVNLRLKQVTLRSIDAGNGTSLELLRMEAATAMRDAEVRVLGAEQALINLGFSVRAADYRDLPQEKISRWLRSLSLNGLPVGDSQSANLLPLRSSTNGIVMSTDVVTGEVIEVGRVLFTVVDPTQLWARLNVKPADAPRVLLDQEVQFRPDGAAEVFTGRVLWIGTNADETTRTIPIRVDLANAHGRLRASTLGVGKIVINHIPSAIVAPRSAMADREGGAFVFVRDADYLKPNGPKAFHVRPVQVGARDGDTVAIINGLKVGDVIAAKGIDFLKKEWRRGQTTRKEQP